MKTFEKAWHYEKSTFAYSTDYVLITNNDIASLEIAYLPKDKVYGYCLLVVNSNGELLLNQSSEHFTFKSIKSLLQAIKEDTKIQKYMGKLPLPSAKDIRELITR